MKKRPAIRASSSSPPSPPRGRRERPEFSILLTLCLSLVVCSGFISGVRGWSVGGTAYTPVSRWGQTSFLATLPSDNSSSSTKPLLIVVGGKTTANSGYTFNSAPNTNDILILDASSPISDLSKADWKYVNNGPQVAWGAGSVLEVDTDSGGGVGMTGLVFGGDQAALAVQTNNDSSYLFSVGFSNSNPTVNWTSLPTSPTPSTTLGQPQRMLFSSMISLRNSLTGEMRAWIFGGLKDDGSGSGSDELWIWQGTASASAVAGNDAVSSGVWGMADGTGGPGELWDHTATLVTYTDYGYGVGSTSQTRVTKAFMVVIGGVSKPSSTSTPTLSSLSTLYVFTPSLAVSSDQAASGTWSTVQTTGDVPPPRRGHSAVMLGDGKTIWVWGGSGGVGSPLTGSPVDGDGAKSPGGDNEALGWLLDTSVRPMTWSKVVAAAGSRSKVRGLEGRQGAAGAGPGVRWGHFAERVGTNVMVGFGYLPGGPADSSLYVFNSNSFSWAASYTPSLSSSGSSSPTGGGGSGSSQGGPSGSPTSGASGSGSPTATGPGSAPSSSGIWSDPSGDPGPTGSRGPDGGNGGDGKKAAVAIGSVLAVLGALAVCGGGYYFYRKRRRYDQRFCYGYPAAYVNRRKRRRRFGGGGGVGGNEGLMKETKPTTEMANIGRGGRGREGAGRQASTGQESTHSMTSLAGATIQKAVTAVWARAIGRERDGRRFDMLEDDVEDGAVDRRQRAAGPGVWNVEDDDGWIISARDDAYGRMGRPRGATGTGAEGDNLMVTSPTESTTPQRWTALPGGDPDNDEDDYLGDLDSRRGGMAIWDGLYGTNRNLAAAGAGGGEQARGHSAVGTSTSFLGAALGYWVARDPGGKDGGDGSAPGTPGVGVNEVGEMHALPTLNADGSYSSTNIVGGYASGNSSRELVGDRTADDLQTEESGHSGRSQHTNVTGATGGTGASDPMTASSSSLAISSGSGSKSGSSGRPLSVNFGQSPSNGSLYGSAFSPAAAAKPYEGLTRSSTWWDRFTKASILGGDQRARNKSEVRPGADEPIRDPAPAPALLPIREASNPFSDPTTAEATDEHGRRGQERSETAESGDSSGKSSAEVSLAHGRSISSRRSAGTATSSMLEQRLSRYDVVQKTRSASGGSGASLTTASEPMTPMPAGHPAAGGEGMIWQGSGTSDAGTATPGNVIWDGADMVTSPVETEPQHTFPPIPASPASSLAPSSGSSSWHRSQTTDSPERPRSVRGPRPAPPSRFSYSPDPSTAPTSTNPFGDAPSSPQPASRKMTAGEAGVKAMISEFERRTSIRSSDGRPPSSPATQRRLSVSNVPDAVAPVKASKPKIRTGLAPKQTLFVVNPDDEHGSA